VLFVFPALWLLVGKKVYFDIKSKRKKVSQRIKEVVSNIAGKIVFEKAC
jgi:hypothetical protein